MRRDRVFLFGFSAPWLGASPLPRQGYARVLVRELSLGPNPSAGTIARDAVDQAHALLPGRPLHLERAEVLKGNHLSRYAGPFGEHPLLKKCKVPITRSDI